MIRSGRILSYVLFGASLVFFLLGVGFQVWGLLAGGYPSFEPLLLAAYALPFLVWSAIDLRRARQREPSRLVPMLGLALLVAGPVLHAQFTDVPTRVVRPMTWSVQPAADTARASEVTLRFVDRADHFVRLQSPQLATYLASLDARTVDVEFELSSDFGRVGAFHVVRVGDLTRFRQGFTSSGCAAGPCEWPW